MTDHELADLAQRIVNMLDSLSDSDREDVLGAVGMVYCQHCGAKQPKNDMCQCWNDE